MLRDKLLNLLKRAKPLLLLAPQGLIMPKQNRHEAVASFHRLYYDSYIIGRTWWDTYWLGVPTQKCPLDLWVYQEIIVQEKPDVIIECGTAEGGSARFMASVCDQINHGRIISVDIEDRKDRPQHPRITYFLGSSTDEATVREIRGMMHHKDKVLVILDSDHSMGHVLRELSIYSKFVDKGGYLIVEDTNLNGHPVVPAYGPGPMEAVEAFLKANRDFEIDESKEKFFLTFNPNGYLRRVRGAAQTGAADEAAAAADEAG